MPALSVSGVPAKEAIEHIRAKMNIPTSRWDSMMRESHAKAFTVAGAMKMDLVSDLHGIVTKAIENGETLEQFRLGFDDVADRHGWKYKGDRNWRTSVIYNTNLKTAHMAGRWKQMQRTKAARPYLVYMTVGDSNVRPAHAQWRSIALPIDDPWWDSHYPPNDWGCRCFVISATDAELKSRGIEVAESPEIHTEPRINTRTGEDYGQVPTGIGTGWNYNVGKAWLGTDIAFGQKLINLPPAIRSQVLNNNSAHIAQLGKSWRTWLSERIGQKPAGYAHTVGYLPDSLITHLADKNMPKSAAIVVFDKETDHLAGSHKPLAKRIPPAWLAKLPENLADYQAIVRHKDDILFVLKPSVDNKKGRAVISINFKRKGETFNSVRSLGVMLPSNLKGKDYEVIEGEI